jgi:hypothetical protein
MCVNPPQSYLNLGSVGGAELCSLSVREDRKLCNERQILLGLQRKEGEIGMVSYARGR